MSQLGVFRYLRPPEQLIQARFDELKATPQNPASLLSSNAHLEIAACSAVE